MIGGNVLVDAFMTGHLGAASNLLGAVVFAQQRLDQRPVQGRNPWSRAGLLASVAGPRMCAVRDVTRCCAAIAMHLTTNRAGGTAKACADGSKGMSCFAQRMDLVSFRLGQVTSEHEQLHLAV